MSKWCMHIHMRKKQLQNGWGDDCWIISYVNVSWSISYDVIPDFWKMCPICGAPRPKEEPKSELLEALDLIVGLIEEENAMKAFPDQRLSTDLLKAVIKAKAVIRKAEEKENEH